MSTTETQKTEREEGLELALQLMAANSEGLAKTTNTLIDNLTHERDELRATLAAIRDRVSSIVEGQWMPTPHAITKALWPSDEEIAWFKGGEDRD